MLHQSAYKGHDHLIKLLVEKNANVNAKDKFNQTPLMHACHVGNFNSAKLLISYKADVFAVSDSAKTALMITKEFFPSALADLIQHFLNTEQHTAFINQTQNTQTVVIQSIEEVIDEEIPVVQEPQPVPSLEDCLKAIEKSDLNLLRKLIELKADVNQVSPETGVGLLMMASFKGDKDIVECLLRNNANPNAKDTKNQTALMQACYAANIDIAIMLIQNDADFFVESIDGLTAPMIGMQNCKEQFNLILNAFLEKNEKMEEQKPTEENLAIVDSTQDIETTESITNDNETTNTTEGSKENNEQKGSNIPQVVKETDNTIDMNELISNSTRSTKTKSSKSNKNQNSIKNLGIFTFPETIVPPASLKLRLITDLVELFDVIDLTERYYQPSYKIKLKVNKAFKIVFDTTRYEVAKLNMKEPNRTTCKFFGGSHEDMISVLNHGFSTKQGKFGLGVYFSHYSNHAALKFNDSTNTSFLLICEVAIGKYWTLDCGMIHLDREEVLSRGFDSVYGQGGCEKTGGALFDEMVIYNTDQAVPLYLVEYSFQLL